MWAMRRTPTSTTSMKRLSSCALAVLREKNMRIIPPKYEKTYQEKDAVFKITRHTNWKTQHFATLHNFIQFLPRIEWTWQIFMIRCCCACALLWSQNVHLRLLSPKVVSMAFLTASHDFKTKISILYHFVALFWQNLHLPLFFTLRPRKSPEFIRQKEH